MSGWDFYYYRPEADPPWWGCDMVGLVDNLAHKPRQTTAVKVGRTIATVDYQRIKRAAQSDPDFRLSGSPKHEESLPQTPQSVSRGQT